MKTITRIMAFLLVFVMLAGVLASCGDNETPAGPDDPGTKDPSGEQRIEPDLPDVRFDGQDFIIRCVGPTSTGVWDTIGMYAEEKNGDPINDATLERNNAIQKRWGVKVSTIEGSGVAGSVTNAVLNQLDEFDIAIITVDGIGTVAPKYVYDLKQVPHIDLTKPWYDQNFNKEVSIGGRLYATTGDLPIHDDNGTWSVLFNKRMAEDYEMPNLYKLVLKDGTWTLDKLYELAATVTKDDTGDDIKDENDIWGFQTESYNAYAIVASSGERIASKDADDMPYLTAGSEKFSRVFAKAVEICGDKNVTFLETDYMGKFSNIWTDCYIPLFTSGRVLFKMVGLTGITIARNMDDEVGVLPMPKFEESQEYSLSPITVANASCVVIPASVSNIEKTAIITEAMFAESRYTTRIAYYETTLKKKYAADDESKQILDQIIEHRTYDLGAIYGWGGVLTKLQSMLGSRSSNFSSSYKSLERVAQNALNKTVKDFQAAQNVGQ